LQNNVKFAYIDITENMTALKAFVNYRESRPEFKAVKERGGLGVPCIVVNNGEKIIVEDDLELLAELCEEYKDKHNK
jgi:glutaredoxin-related protein